jgi:TPR repeat protein
MRSTLISLIVLTATAAACTTGSAPRATSPAVAVGDPSRAAAPAGGPDADARARELLALGRAAMGRGDAAGAATAFREGLRLQPDLIEARESLGLALYEMGDLDGAVEELRALLRGHPDAVRARYVLASALMAKQDWSSARAELEDVLRRQPDLVPALYSLGLARYALGDPNGAIEAYRQVLARTPDQPDARYNLALVLKLAHRDAEATPEFVAAARAGHARAQFFAGTAYARGLGVEPDMARAIAWWSRAADQGSLEAGAALGELRQTVLGKTRRAPGERRAVEQAFRDYRTALWSDHPELARAGDDDTVGGALLRQGRDAEAVPVLIWEALAFSEPAQTLLEDLYYHGAPGRIAPYDPRILGYFKTAADDGQVRARITLARLYAAGLGVPKDTARAIALLKSTPHEDAQRLLQEISTAPEAVPPAPARP